MAGRLTEANWQSRRIKLREHAAAAQRAYEDVALRRELDEATDEDVAAAHATMVELENRRAALDAAWVRTQEEIAADNAENDLVARRAAAAAIEELLTDRIAAAHAIEQATTDLTASWRRFEEASNAIVGIAIPYHVQGQFDVLHLREDALGHFGSPAYLIMGLLKAGGLDLSGIDPSESVLRLREMGVQQFVEQRNEGIRTRVAKIAPAEPA